MYGVEHVFRAERGFALNNILGVLTRYPLILHKALATEPVSAAIVNAICSSLIRSLNDRDIGQIGNQSAW
ncbi:MAG TPA: hypothetical protein VF273_11440 [Pelobium sp.]